MTRTLSCASVLLLVALSLCDMSAAVQNAYNFTCDLSPQQHDRILQEAINNLQNDDFTVEKGIMRFIFPNGAFAANPSSPYGVYIFNGQQPDLPLWRLDETDAIVFFGCTPPPAEYFSFRSYVFTTLNNLRPDIVFASLGDSTNNLVINTTGLNTGDPFGKTTVMTTTADVITDQAVREAFSAAGLPSTAINTDIVPSSVVQLGQSAMSDTFTMLYRVAIFEDPEGGQAYINTTWPIIRISPRSPQSPLPFPTPPLRERGTGKTEASFSSSFLAFVNQVDKTVQRKLRPLKFRRNVRYTVSSNRMSVVPLEGFECIEEFTNCLGDNRDATYMNTTRRYRLEEDDDSFFIVCGLNHVMTGKATYINFAVGNVVSVDDSVYEGSARMFAPKFNMENVDMFYAYKVARNCNGEDFCLEVPVDQINGRRPFNIVARAYLEPPTKVGPDGDELLAPIVLYYRTGRSRRLQ